MARGMGKRMPEPVPGSPGVPEEPVRQAYEQIISLVERVHRYFLELMKLELERRGVLDINNVQSLLLYNIGPETLTVGDLTLRGYYLGSNVTYNLKKLVEAGYVEQEPSPRDRRSVYVRLSDKGLQLHGQLKATFDRHAGALAGAGISAEDVERLPHMLNRLERFWNRQMDQVTSRAGRPGRV